MSATADKKRFSRRCCPLTLEVEIFQGQSGENFFFHCLLISSRANSTQNSRLDDSSSRFEVMSPIAGHPENGVHIFDFAVKSPTTPCYFSHKSLVSLLRFSTVTNSTTFSLLNVERSRRYFVPLMATKCVFNLNSLPFVQKCPSNISVQRTMAFFCRFVIQLVTDRAVPAVDKYLWTDRYPMVVVTNEIVSNTMSGKWLE